MARAKKTTSAKIREALSSTPDKPVVQIAKELGIKPALVYNVRANDKKKAEHPTGKPGRKPGSKHPKVAAPVAAHAALDSTFEFVVKVGGLLHAEQLIAKLRSIKDRL